MAGSSVSLAQLAAAFVHQSANSGALQVSLGAPSSGPRSAMRSAESGFKRKSASRPMFISIPVAGESCTCRLSSIKKIIIYLLVFRLVLLLIFFSKF